MGDTDLACAACGNALPAQSRFCNECGTPVSAPTREAEYKQVTVLFADVVHSMDLASAVGPERLREIMVEMLDRSAAVVGRYAGTVNSFTGDGVMAVFGAPTALEDHAFRACLAALGIQQEIRSLAEHVAARDGISLQVRVGLNSGQVIAGEIGSAPASYTAIGEQVGMAQRMESVAPPGGVMLSESTARLVENSVELGAPERVTVKGATMPVTARRLLAIVDRRPHRRTEPAFVGRTWELNAIATLLEEAKHGSGCVVDIVGPPGIGKSRLVREAAAIAADLGVPVFSTYCESHAGDIPLHALGRLLRAAMEVDDVDADTARTRVHEQFADADATDLLLLNDLLGIGDPAIPLPDIAADARRRRLTALINSASLERGEPAMYVIEDAHWIDAASESMLADFLTVVPQSRAVTLITYRPEYHGTLTRVSGAQTIALRPLSDGQVVELSTEMLGTNASVAALTETIAERAAGNPFFVQEMVRDLSERGMLHGEPGNYELRSAVEDVEVPATLQAAIGARIDRLSPSAKRTLHAAAVIGGQFDAELLAVASGNPDVEPLVQAELVDQIRFAPIAVFAFRHPMIRSVAYEAQLKSDRAQRHQRLATAIEQRVVGAGDENAALIAQHYEAAGDLDAAFDWYMRAGAWFNLRDNAAASQSWRRALAVADRVVEGDPSRRSMRIAPISLLCATTYRAMPNPHVSFDELRDLCIAAGDRQSLAVGMMGHVMERFFRGERRAASRIATELVEHLESIGDPTLTVALIPTAITAKHEAGDLIGALRWAERVVDIAGEDATKGKLTMGSPLALSLAFRGVLRSCLGIEGWREDLRRAVEIAVGGELITRTSAVYYAYTVSMMNGALLPDEFFFRESSEVLSIAEQVAENVTLGVARFNRGIALLERGDIERGLELIALVREAATQGRYPMVALPLVDAVRARELARIGECDRAIQLARPVLDGLSPSDGPMSIPLVAGTLVEALSLRGDPRDLDEAGAVVDRLAALSVEAASVLKEIWLLRCRALLAHAHDDRDYGEHRDRYRARAGELGFEGHIAMAEAMP